MLNPRYRPVRLALVALAFIWLATWGGFHLAARAKMTAPKFSAYAAALDLDRLSGEPRARALRALADKLNRLPIEDRRRVRLERVPDRLFAQMTEEEKAEFIEATMPTGFKQMIASFEQLPADKRKRAVDRAVKQLQAAREGEGGFWEERRGTNAPPAVSEELQRKILTLGLRAFYRDSSAQTKAEVAPLLEELQRAMENRRLFNSHP
jgi:hypothetical protein